MITIIIDKVSDWKMLVEKFGIAKDETFYTVISHESGKENVLVWFLKDNCQYAVRCPEPIYKESIKAAIHESE